jgi:hypothetical protein
MLLRRTEQLARSLKAIVVAFTMSVLMLAADIWS